MSSNRIEDSPYAYLRTVILSRSDTSYWLRAALAGLDERDPVDALSDVAVLKGLLDKRLDEIRRERQETPVGRDWVGQDSGLV